MSRIGTPLAYFIGMENAKDSEVKPFIETMRRTGDLGGGELPTLDEMMEAYVGHVLGVTSYNVARTARILDISRSTLYRRFLRA
jgi:transcriptional regulator of acetoin/glycerol metabolism